MGLVKANLASRKIPSHLDFVPYFASLYIAHLKKKKKSKVRFNWIPSLIIWLYKAFHEYYSKITLILGTYRFKLVNIPPNRLDKYLIADYDLWQHRFWWNSIIPYCPLKSLIYVDIQHLPTTKKKAKWWKKPFKRLLNCICHT